MYKRFKKMFIDEDKIKFDLSDHHLLEALFEVRCQTDSQRKEKELITYMKINEDTKSKFLERFENEISEVDDCRLEIFEEKAKNVSKEVMETKF